MGCRPTFLVVGARRCGTTSLWRLLQRHPDVAMAASKEPRYFDANYARGPDWYHDQFPCDAVAIGEASPTYLQDHEALARIARDLPDVRLVAMLRHPIERAHSHYWMQVRRELRTGSFAESVEAELATGAHDLLWESGYARHLEVVADLGLLDRLHVVLLDDFEADPGRVAGAVLSHLGVDPDALAVDAAVRVNEYQEFRSLRLRRLGGRLPRPLRDAIGRVNRVEARYAPVDPALRARLVEHFAPLNDELVAILGRPLPGPWYA